MQHEYNDWQMHFEDCPDCKMHEPCSTGKAIQERLKKEATPPKEPEF